MQGEDSLRQIFERDLSAIPLPPREAWRSAVAPEHAQRPPAAIRAAAMVLVAALTLIAAVFVGLSLASLRAQTERSAASPSPSLTPMTFEARRGAVDPLTAARAPQSLDLGRVRLAAGAEPVDVRFDNGLPQFLIITDSAGRSLFTIGSMYGPGHPVLDLGFLQVFVAETRGDGSQQVMYAYGTCDPNCAATRVAVIGMARPDAPVVETLEVGDLTNAVVDVRNGEVVILEQLASGTRETRYRWEAESRTYEKVP